MRKTLAVVTCALLFIGATSFKKGNDSLLIGTWKFDSMELPDSLKNDPETKAAIEMVSGLMQDLTLEFKKDGNYEIVVIGQTTVGQYKYNGKKATLSMSSDDGGKNMFDDAKVIKLDKKWLVLGDKESNITFKRE